MRYTGIERVPTTDVMVKGIEMKKTLIKEILIKSTCDDGRLFIESSGVFQGSCHHQAKLSGL